MVSKTIWDYKVLHPSDLEPYNKCKHSFMDRRALTGDGDYQALKHVKCFGNHHVIPSRDGNGGTLCKICDKHFCANSGCICKSN